MIELMELAHKNNIVALSLRHAKRENLNEKETLLLVIEHLADCNEKLLKCLHNEMINKPITYTPVHLTATDVLVRAFTGYSKETVLEKLKDYPHYPDSLHAELFGRLGF